MHQWMSDSGLTPHVIVSADLVGEGVLRAQAQDGKIVLNLSYSATHALDIGNDWIDCDTRFSGVSHHIRVPMAAVLGVYARETGEGMVFSETETGTNPPAPGPGSGPGAVPPRGAGPAAGAGAKGSDKDARRAKFKVVK